MEGNRDAEKVFDEMSDREKNSWILFWYFTFLNEKFLAVLDCCLEKGPTRVMNMEIISRFGCLKNLLFLSLRYGVSNLENFPIQHLFDVGRQQPACFSLHFRLIITTTTIPTVWLRGLGKLEDIIMLNHGRTTMKQDWPSTISKTRVNAIAEGSDSSCITCPFPANGCSRQGRSLTSKFKGVVPQQNGHWGAQIYANHQRIWLGTFKSENEAAMAYDSAAIRIRSGDCHRNFPWTKFTIEEPNFQKLYTTEALLNMLKDGSYRTKFAEYLRDRSESAQTSADQSAAKIHNNEGTSIKQLFQKELTPSDVGKLNRLVIPKKYAVKYFPHISASTIENAEHVDDDRDVQLVFFDKMMRQWKFRYCYWKSSQSYVFTRGWNRFVKENQLKANDTIAFYLCEAAKGSDAKTTFCVVDVKDRNNGGSSFENVTTSSEMQLDSGHQEALELLSPKHVDDELKDDGEVKGFKLFGVHIK